MTTGRINQIGRRVEWNAGIRNECHHATLFFMIFAKSFERIETFTTSMSNFNFHRLIVDGAHQLKLTTPTHNKAITSETTTQKGGAYEQSKGRANVDGPTKVNARRPTNRRKLRPRTGSLQFEMADGVLRNMLLDDPDTLSRPSKHAAETHKVLRRDGNFADSTRSAGTLLPLHI